MTYTPNVPQANQRIAQTQSPIQANFTYLEDSLERDHAWQGNIIGTEDPGRHQKASFPNQGADIAALPTGCASVLYAIGGNLFAYNGSKQPVSGVKGSGTLTITTSYQTVFTAPANSIGIITFSGSTSGASNTFFFCTMPVAAPPTFPAWISNISPPAVVGTVVLAQFSTLDFQVARFGGSNFSSAYKYLYWPV